MSERMLDSVKESFTPESCPFIVTLFSVQPSVRCKGMLIVSPSVTVFVQLFPKLSE